MKHLLIVQFRHEPHRQHERDIFCAEFPELRERFWFLDALTESFPEDLSDIAGVMYCGSGPFYLSTNDGVGSWRDAALAFLDRVVESDIPVMGICFGFQMIALHQGAKVIRDDQKSQVGTFVVTRFESSQDDELLSAAPVSHTALFAHKDVVVELPSHIIPMCRTERVECSSFRIAGKRVWGTLFHPEFTKQRVSERLHMSPEYAAGDSVDAVAGTFSDCPEAAEVLHRFMEITGLTKKGKS